MLKHSIQFVGRFIGVDSRDHQKARSGEGRFQTGLIPDIGEARDDDIADPGEIGRNTIVKEFRFVIFDLYDGM